jgi:transposase-like protein
MKMKKRTYTPEFKTKTVLEVLREEKTLSEIASAYNIHPNMLRNWNREFLEKASSIFEDSKQRKDARQKELEIEADHAKMLETIGQLTLERDWLKKKSIEVFGPDYEKKFSKRPF